MSRRIMEVRTSNHGKIISGGSKEDIPESALQSLYSLQEPYIGKGEKNAYAVVNPGKGVSC